MTESAISLRERRKVETARALKDVARRLTAERGLSGYTIDEVCEQVGVSRRTFFNYFASKENAVLGFATDLDESGAAERFLARGARGTSHLVNDLVDLTVERWRFGGATAEDLPALSHACEREPRLLAHLLYVIGEAERDDRELVELREGMSPGDPRAATAVQLVGVVLRGSVEELFSGRSADDLPVIVERRLAVLRDLLR